MAFDFITDVVGAPFRMIDGAIRGAAEAAIPRNQKKLDKKKAKDGRKAARKKAAALKEGTNTLQVQARDGRMQNLILQDRLATHQQITSMARETDERIDAVDDEVDDIIKDLAANDDTTNGLIELVNKMQDDDAQQGEALRNLAAAVDELKKQTAVAVPAQSGQMNPMMLMAMGGGGGGLNPAAMLLMGQGGMGGLNIPVYRDASTNGMYVDAFYTTMIMDVVAGLGIFGDRTASAREGFARAQVAAEAGDEAEVRRIVSEVGSALGQIVREAVSDVLPKE